MIVYSVLAQRYGDKEGHHYIVGVFKERDHAVTVGKQKDCIVEANTNA